MTFDQLRPNTQRMLARHFDVSEDGLFAIPRPQGANRHRSRYLMVPRREQPPQSPRLEDAAAPRPGTPVEP